ncbi:VOC family protein [Candidatus Pacearchaeota archaeon]|nr:VOC family protein [Candidatus Pacearchaeota archaeon]
MDKVVHFEIPYNDAGRATKFYSEVFDWDIEAVPEMNYHMVRTVEVDKKRMPKVKGAINGGMFKRDGLLKGPLITIDVKDIEDTIEKIEENGGKVVREKMNIGDMGYVAYFSDSEGNIVGLWETMKKS